MKNRKLNWDGCDNVRDLGGLPARNGFRTRWGALVRSDTPSKLTATGWQSLQEHGIRTIITLRTEGISEPELELPFTPSGVGVVSIAVEDLSDVEFLQNFASSDLWCTPLYYQDTLKRWPQRHARVVSVFSHARPGGVLIHCSRGQDRTGLMVLILLALVGVPHEHIVADYEMSLDPARDKILRSRDTCSRKVILDVLANLDAEEYLLSAGMRIKEIAAAKNRFLEPLNLKK